MRHAAGMLTTFGFASALCSRPVSPTPPTCRRSVLWRRRSSTEPPTWQGFYFGGNLGAAFDPYNLSIKDLSAAQDLSLKFSNDTEFIGGVHGGYNWQAGGLLLGIEGDIAFASDIDYLASARGRIGWATPNWLVLRYRRRRVHRHQHEFHRGLRR